MPAHTACVTYVLRDPVSNEIRYIGLTLDPLGRARAHSSPVKQPKSPLDRWKNRLHRRGLRPVFQAVSCFPNYGCGSDAEKHSIEYHAVHFGPKLLNREHNPLFSDGKFVGRRFGFRWFPRLMIEASFPTMGHRQLSIAQ